MLIVQYVVELPVDVMHFQMFFDLKLTRMFRQRPLILFIFSFIGQSTLFAQLPAGFASSVLQNGYTAPMGVVFTNNGNSMWTWEKSGKVYISKWNGTTYVKQVTPVLDISDEVGDWRDFGLLSIC